jgi:hypothetical protein
MERVVVATFNSVFFEVTDVYEIVWFVERDEEVWW